MLSMWMECCTQKEIADAVGVSRPTVVEFLQKVSEIDNHRKSTKSAILHDDASFKPQVYEIWSFAKATNKVRHFGNIPPEIIDNLLYYYTRPFDVVFDPFAGGGSTIDVCRKRFRRCSSTRSPWLRPCRSATLAGVPGIRLRCAVAHRA